MNAKGPDTHPTLVQPVEPSQLRMNWMNSLRFKLAIGLLSLFLLLVGFNLWFIWSEGLPFLIRQNQAFDNQLGENLVVSLDQQIKQAEALAKDMANIAEELPNQAELYHRLMPNLLNMESMQSLVTGGGIWPEPHQFDRDKTRNSFFWARNQEGNLTFFDNYNDLQGPGYHHEEWYVPTTQLKEGDVYWSRSYTDPYSLQPMVTCSVPIYKEQKLHGVATVDLDLEGISQLLINKLKDHSGYAFAIDRNHKFIAFPSPSLVKSERKDSEAKTYEDFVHIDELALTEPVFKLLASKLLALQSEHPLPVADSNKLRQMSQFLSDNSYQITPAEADQIARALLTEANDDVLLLSSFQLSDDLLLHEEVNVTVYQMPHTFWKIVTVFPAEKSLRIATEISKTATWLSLSGITLWGLLCALFLHRILFARLQDMTGRIRQSAKNEQQVLLDNRFDDELGILARWYNYRTQQLQQALESARINGEELQQENNEHHKTTRLLEKALSLQNAILDHVHIAILALDDRGIIQSCNHATFQMLGYHEHELIGCRFPEPLLNVPFEDIRNMPEVDGHRQKEWLFRCKSGVTIRGLMTLTPIQDQHHSQEGWLLIIAK